MTPLIMLILATAAVLSSALWLASCGQSVGHPTGPTSLRVIFTGETEGELEPCNCAGQMAGGLPVRGGYLAAATGARVLVDVGCIGAGARAFEQYRLEAALRAMQTMDYDAINVGEHELWLGRDDLARLSGQYGPFVSANVSDAQGQSVVAPYVQLQRGDTVAAITGVVDHRADIIGPGLMVSPPAEALARVLPEMRQHAQVLIVLADLREKEVRELANRFPEITLILFRGRGDSLPPQRVNRSIIASIYGEARYIGDLTLTWDDRRQLSAIGEAVVLDDRFAASDAVYAASIDWYKQTIDGRTFDFAEPRPGSQLIQPIQPGPGNGYIGSDACTRCHQYQHDHWWANRHAHAMESLKRVGYDYSPECVVCHVVGLGAADGYVSMAATPHLGNVGCEACHGPGKAVEHGNCKGKVMRGDETTCKRCHVGKHDPEFRFADDWARIDHTERR